MVFVSKFQGIRKFKPVVVVGISFRINNSGVFVSLQTALKGNKMKCCGGY
mgnify:CR=1 FL=1